MRIISLAVLSLVVATAAFADRLTEQCREIYDEIIADVPLDIEQCTPVVPAYEQIACEKPGSFNGQLPASHLILAIDASGSMAGKIGGESKMAIAKREALAFLQTLDKNISVGLAVYGHHGNNKQDGKAESCASSEMVHGFNAPRAELAETISSLSPTGWTPMAGVLTFAGAIVADLPKPSKSQPALAPVIYMISDGEETCDGDPVSVARTLNDAGVRTTVNTIGFAVDGKTKAQLMAIAEAGGGKFYPAENGSILRRQLREIAQAERDIITYEQCVAHNANLIHFAFSKVSGPAMRCYNANNPSGLLQAVMAAQRKASPDDEVFKACSNQMVFQASDDRSSYGNWMKDVLIPFDDHGRQLQDEYLKENGFPPRHGK